MMPRSVALPTLRLFWVVLQVSEPENDVVGLDDIVGLEASRQQAIGGIDVAPLDLAVAEAEKIRLDHALVRDLRLVRKLACLAQRPPRRNLAEPLNAAVLHLLHR